MAASMEAAARRVAFLPRPLLRCGPEALDLGREVMSRLDHLGKSSASTHITLMEKDDTNTDPKKQRQEAAARALAEAQARRDAHIVEKRASEKAAKTGQNRHVSATGKKLA